MEEELREGGMLMLCMAWLLLEVGGSGWGVGNGGRGVELET